MSEKFCKDCVHVIGHGSGAKCGRDRKRADTYLVTGDPRDIEYYLCSVTRAYECGLSAKWFQPKKPEPSIDLGDGPIIDGEVVNGHEAPKFIQRLLARLK